SFLSYSSAPPRDLHSFPTRRSSDLLEHDQIARAELAAAPEVLRHAADQPARSLARDHQHPRQQARGRGLAVGARDHQRAPAVEQDRKSTRLNSSHVKISYAVFCLKK